MRKKISSRKNKIFSVLKMINDYVELLSLFAIFLFIYGVFAKKTYNDFKTIKNNDCKIGEVRKITEQVRTDHEVGISYEVEISYKENGETVYGTFIIKKDIGGAVSGAFDSRYRKGNKIPVLVGKNGNVIPYAERKNTIVRDIVIELVVFMFLALSVFLVVTQFGVKYKEEEYNRKEFYCILFDLLMYLSFIVVGVIFFFSSEYGRAMHIFLVLGLLFYLVQVAMKKEIRMRGGVISYEKNPVLFSFLFMFYLCFIIVMLTHI